MEQLFELLQPYSLMYGSGDVTADLMFLLVLALIIAGLLFTFILVRGSGPSRAAPADQTFDRMSAVLGRLERIEMTVNATKTEMMRAQSFLENRVSHLEEQVAGMLGHTILEADQKEEEGKVSSAAEEMPEEETLEEGPEEEIGPPPSLTPEEIGQDEDEEEDEDPSPLAAFPKTRETVVDSPQAESAPAPSETESAPEESAAAQKKTLLSGLKKSRSGLFQKLKSVFSGKPKLDQETLDELEAVLISADLGVGVVSELIEELKQDVAEGKEVGEEALASLLKLNLLKRLEKHAQVDPRIKAKRTLEGPLVVMMVGVNGVGKTTTTAKLASQWKEAGASVLMVAADTFRAAAVEQLNRWGEELGVAVQKGDDEQKPATVVFDAMERAKQENFDVIVIDTAGRLHTKSNLMQELEGIKNIVSRHQPNAPHETILVVDGATGQNALQQAKDFDQATKLTGLVVTKLDGTPKGGIVVAIQDELGVPVRYIGIGESQEDLRPFDPREFVEALLSTSELKQLSEPSAHGRRRRRRRDDAESQALSG